MVEANEQDAGCGLGVFPVQVYSTFEGRCVLMSDTRSVELVVRLPEEMANSVEEVRDRDPEYLNRLIRYGIVRRAVYRELLRSS